LAAPEPATGIVDTQIDVSFCETSKPTNPATGTSMSEPLSDNATQVLTAAFAGIVGALGSYLGYKAGERAGRNGREDP
jgi:hypothetical protein